MQSAIWVLAILSYAYAAVCPLNCNCSHYPTSFACDGVKFASIAPLLSPSLRSLHLTNCNAKTLDIKFFENVPRLRNLKLEACGIQAVQNVASGYLAKLRHLNLAGNRLKTFSDSEARQQLTKWRNVNISYFETIDWGPFWPALRVLNLSRNGLHRVDVEAPRLRDLDIADNELTRLPASSPSIRRLDLSGNAVESAGEVDGNLSALSVLDLSRNRVRHIRQSLLDSLPALSTLDLSDNSLRDTEILVHPKLTHLNLSNSKLSTLNTSHFQGLSSLLYLDVSGSETLEAVAGRLGEVASLRFLDLSRTSLRTLPPKFLSWNSTKQISVDLRDNGFSCQPCQLAWFHWIGNNVLITDGDQLKCTASLGTPLLLSNVTYPSEEQCKLGISLPANDTITVTAIYGARARLSCPSYGNPTPSVHWMRLYRGEQEQIGHWNARLQTLSLRQEPDNFELLANGNLYIKRADRGHVGRYQCLVANGHGAISADFILRLDYSSWTINVKVFSFFCGAATAAGFFVLNLIWAATRSLVAWRLSRMEKNSRARQLLEALEKYRERQVQSLKEKYTVRMNQIRDNYHLQGEQLRQGYTLKMDNFRDYKAQQMESMTAHIESARENYSQQMARMREYGSRQADRLYESYQRQMNRIRTFSLQQRLRLMRQYKVKQRYLNRLLDGLNIDGLSGDSRSRTEVELIDMPPLPEAEDLWIHLYDPDTISISTYHSLPADEPRSSAASPFPEAPSPKDLTEQ